MVSIVRVGVLALGLFSFVQGCVQSNDVTPPTSAIRFAVEADAVRVATTRTVAHEVNVAEPVFVGFDGESARVTYAKHGRDGVDVTLDRDTLAALTTAARVYPTRAYDEPPAHLSRAHASVTLRDGRTMNVWTDDATGHVLADVDGGMPSTIWTGDVVGAPHAATADGQRVVIAFATSTENGFDLVAMSIEAR